MQLELIPPEKELIIFDFYDTVVQHVYGSQFSLRKGIPELTDYLLDNGKKMVISSDGNEYGINRDFGYAINEMFQSRFTQIYGSMYVNKDNPNNYRLHLTRDVNSRAVLKNLNLICKEQNVPKNLALFIGDNFTPYNNPIGTDVASAEYYGVDYIVVPRNSADFSFFELLSEQ